MEEWIRHTLQSPTLSLTVLSAAFLLGLAGAVSSCCNAAVAGAIAGYSGTQRQRESHRGILLGGGFFLIGSVIALATLGAVTGFVGQVAGASLGRYWKLAAGLVMVVFGLASLNLAPFKLQGWKGPNRVGTGRGLRPMVYGLALGGGTTACSAGCSPILPVVLGVAALQGRMAWGAALLATFAVGYSLPLAGALVGLGLGLGKLTSALQKYAPAIKTVSGIVMVGVGFTLLATA